MKLAGLILLGSFLSDGAVPKLEIEKFALRQFEDGPGLPVSHEFLPGETIYWSFRVRGYHVKKTENDAGDSESSMKLTWSVRATDPKGVPIYKEQSGHVEARLFDQDKDWTPRAADSFIVPPLAPSGIYHATVTVKDESGETTSALEFKVRGDKVEPERYIDRAGPPVPAQ